MTSEGLGEMFEGDSADTCARKFPFMLMWGRANGPACADGERGPPSARAEIRMNFVFEYMLLNRYIDIFLSLESLFVNSVCHFETLKFQGGKPPLILVARFSRTNVAENFR